MKRIGFELNIWIFVFVDFIYFVDVCACWISWRRGKIIVVSLWWGESRCSILVIVVIIVAVALFSEIFGHLFVGRVGDKWAFYLVVLRSRGKANGIAACEWIFIKNLIKIGLFLGIFAVNIRLRCFDGRYSIIILIGFGISRHVVIVVVWTWICSLVIMVLAKDGWWFQERVCSFVSSKHKF